MIPSFLPLKSSPKVYSFDQAKSSIPSDTIKKALNALKEVDFEIDKEPSEFEFYLHTKVSNSQLSTCGKGLTEEQSLASAIMEFCERYSWFNYDIKNAYGYVEETFNEIKKTKVRTVDEDYFLCNFVGIKNKYPLLKKIKNIPMKWVKGYSLTHNCEFYYPIRWHNYIFGSNGLAAGNTYEEAITQAVCELIERECVYRYIVLNEIPFDLDLTSIQNSLIQKFVDKSKEKNIELNLKYISYDLDIPTFMLYGINNNFKDTLLHKGVGHGTYLEPNQAIVRALSEYYQAFSLLHDQIKQVGYNLEYKPNKHYGFLVTYPHDIFYKSKGAKKIDEIKSFAKDDFKDEVEFLVKLLAKKGYEVVVIDKTHPKLKIPVVRVFIPGFRSVIVSEVYDAEMFIITAQNEALKGE